MAGGAAVSRLAGLILALIGAVTFAGAAAPGGAAPLVESVVLAGHDYDAPAQDEDENPISTVRAPPVTRHDAIVRTDHPAVDHRSSGASARLQAVRTFGYTAYDLDVQGVQVDSNEDTTPAQAKVTEDEPSRLSGASVAAKYGDDVAETAARTCSFAGATTVLVADGTRKPIEDIEVGDEVIATDPETGEQVAKTVEHVFVHDDTVIDLVVDGEVITTTEDHPFWSVTDQRFERADELGSSENVLGTDGRVMAVSGLKIETAREALAYNLSVEGIHTYHVGVNEILVHNTCPIHGNSLDSPRPTTLYRLDDADGNLLKWGITSRTNPQSRYTQMFLRDRNLVPIATGTRRDMARIERWMVQYHRGPLNREPWAGGGW
jgi:hypothetical protein